MSAADTGASASSRASSGIRSQDEIAGTQNPGTSTPSPSPCLPGTRPSPPGHDRALTTRPAHGHARANHSRALTAGVLHLVRALRAEALKALASPAAWVGTALAVVLPVALELYLTHGMVAQLEAGDAQALDMLPDMGSAALALSTPGAIVLGTTAVAGEFRTGAQATGSSRMLTTTLLAVPRRGVCVAAKLIVTCLLVLTVFALAAAATLTVTSHALGPWAPLSPFPWLRLAGAATWWVLCALAGSALAAVSRGALVPLSVLLSSMLVSPGVVLAGHTDLVRFLPDTAAWRLVASSSTLGGSRGALPQLLTVPRAFGVCAAWAVACVIVTAVAWVGRDS